MQRPQRRPVGLHLQHPHPVTRLVEGVGKFADLDLAALHVVGPTQRADVDVMGSAEDPRRHVGESRITLLEQFEDAATVVVGDHDGQALRCRLRRPDQQTRAVVHERQVAEKRDGAAPAGTFERQRSADRSGHRSVDAGHAAVGTHLHPGGVEPHQGDVADRVRRAQHQLVTRPHRVRHRRGDVQAGGQRMSGQLLAHRGDGMVVALLAATEPVRRRRAGGDRAGAGRLRVAGHIGPARAGGQREDRHRGVGEQRRNRAVQCRTAQHDDLFGVQQRQRERMQRVARGRRRRLGDRRQMVQVRVHAGAVPGDDHRVGGQVDVQRLVERHRRRVGPRSAAGTALGSVLSARLVGVVGGGHQRLAQRDVELHRPRVGRPRSHGRHQNPARCRPPLGVEGIEFTRRPTQFGCQTQADVGPHLAAEVSQLLERLVGAGAQKFVGPVGRQHDQRNPGVVGLHHRRTQVRHRGARRHRHTDRGALRGGQPDRQEARGAFVDAHVQSQPAGAVGVVQRKRQRGVA